MTETVWRPFEELSLIELYEILKLRSEIFVVEQTCVYNDLDGLDREAMHFMVYEEQQLAAYLRVLKPGTRFSEASIGRVATHRAFRRRGISSQLMKTAMNYIQNTMAAPSISISAQSYLQQFYESLGFRVVSDEYLEDGIPHVEMNIEFEKNEQ